MNEVTFREETGRLLQLLGRDGKPVHYGRRYTLAEPSAEAFTLAADRPPMQTPMDCRVLVIWESPTMPKLGDQPELYWPEVLPFDGWYWATEDGTPVKW